MAMAMTVVLLSSCWLFPLGWGHRHHCRIDAVVHHLDRLWADHCRDGRPSQWSFVPVTPRLIEETMLIETTKIMLESKC